jgi:uncharacterized protein (TIGR02246 family)
MTVLLAMLNCAAMLATSGVSVSRGDTPNDEDAVRSVFSTLEQAWDRPGMPGFETLFTAEADFVVITGKWLKGRDAIVSYHHELPRGKYASSRTLPYSVTVRFLTSEIALAHVATELQ